MARASLQNCLSECKWKGLNTQKASDLQHSFACASDAAQEAATDAVAQTAGQQASHVSPGAPSPGAATRALQAGVLLRLAVTQPHE